MDNGISLDSYKIFCTVVKTGNMSAAAKELYISQPAVSMAVKQLEEKLGSPLLILSLIHICFRLFEVATQIHYILVSDMDPDQFVKTDVIAVKTIEEAIAKAKEITGKDRLSTYIMPYAANTMASMDI